MTARDPFVIGLRAILAARPDVKPAPLGVAAGLDNSTIRKLLNGQILSMKVDSAQKIARELGVNLSTIIALGEHSHGPEIVSLAMAIEEAGPEEQARIDAYLKVAMQAHARSESAETEPQAHQEAEQPSTQDADQSS